MICVSLIISSVEHFFIYLLAICVSSSEKCLFKSSAHFLIVLFLDWVGWAIYIFWILTPYGSDHFPIFYPTSSTSVGWLFTLSMVSFAMQKLLSLVRFHLLIFVFIFITQGGEWEILLQFMSKSVSTLWFLLRAYVFF